jgi:iron complex outermembrane receptor protein
MRTTAYFSIIFLVLAAVTTGQTVTGTVTDASGAGLPFVAVSLPALHRGVVTDTAGRFRLEGIRPGVYALECTCLGYAKETRSVSTTSGDVTLRIALRQTALELPGIVVTGRPQPTGPLTTAQSIGELDGRELARLRGQNVIEALGNLPGVTTYTTGAGIAKPVIRGLTSQRVLVVDDGTRQEGQQWGDEHAPEIDAFDVERIEVLRGPGSVLYGSDALGGVVNVIRHDLPSAAEGDPLLGGTCIGNGFSNNDQAAGDLSLDGAYGVVGYRGHLGFRHAGNVTTPAGPLFNSGMKQTDAGGQLGAKGDWGAVTLDYSHFGQELEIHEDPAVDPAATPFQTIMHDKAHLHVDIPLTGIRLETDGSWQRNVRQEFEERDAVDPSLHLRLRTAALDVRGHHRPIGPVFGTVGVSFQSQINETFGEEKLIPGFAMRTLAGYLYEEAHLGRFDFSGGVRYDTRTLDVRDTPALNVASQTRTYDAVTGDLGAVYRLTQPLAVSVNVGTGWRAPSPFELFVDGVHEGTVQYLVGDATLATEHSVNVDVSLRCIAPRLRGEATVYRNAVGDFIFADPTGDTDPVSGFRMYRLEQADATLTGAEFSADVEATDWLVIDGAFDFVRGRNERTGVPLPLMPADRLSLEVKGTVPSIGILAHPYVSSRLRLVASQTRIEDFETPTSGYALVDAGIGAEISIGGLRRMTVDVRVENLLNRAYRDHLNRFKEYALDPGRDVQVKVSVPFTVVQ